MYYYSPLRYPGGKNKAITLFREVVKVNKMKGCVYVEPFAGGASVAIGLLIEGDANRIIINDADPSIYSFWFSCINNIEEFCLRLNETAVNIDEWQRQKDSYRQLRQIALRGDDYDIMQLGFATFYLNRANRSGILKGGMIGGRSQTGKYGINARFNKPELEVRLRNVASMADRIEIHCEDAKSFIENNVELWPDNTLIYCDPPYVQKGRGLYMNYFKREDHLALSETIKGIKDKKWVVTYDMDPLIEELYHDYLNKKLTLSYSASHKHSTSKSDEYIFFSPNLIVPDDEKLAPLDL